MRRLAGSAWRLAVLIILAASTARGQEQFKISDGTRKFGAIQLAQDARSARQGGTPEGQTAPAKKQAAQVHRFWDKQNIILFAGVGAARGLDYSSTLNLRRRGVNEALLTNAIVDDHPEFAAIEVATAAASVGLSYIFHATGHHKLERWTSYVHIGVTVAGAGRNYALKTVHTPG